MILDLYMYPQGLGYETKWEFVDCKTKEIVAYAENGQLFWTVFRHNNRIYQYKKWPHLLTRKFVDFKYPFVSPERKKTVGFNILSEKDVVAQYYGDAMKCRDKGINKNIGVKMYLYNERTYMSFTVGLPKKKSHYYCIYNEANELISIIARHISGSWSSNCKATLYVKNEENLLITLFACVDNIVDVNNYGKKGERHDPSAGPYVSSLKEERELFIPSFIDEIESEVYVDEIKNKIDEKELEIRDEIMIDKIKGREIFGKIVILSIAIIVFLINWIPFCKLLF